MLIKIDADAEEQIVAKSLQEWLLTSEQGDLSNKERKAMLRVLSLYMAYNDYRKWVEEEYEE